MDMKFYGIMYGDGDCWPVMDNRFFRNRENAVKCAEAYGWTVIPGEPNYDNMDWVGHTQSCYVVECHFED